jgi:hypothetical protein
LTRLNLFIHVSGVLHLLVDNGLLLRFKIVLRNSIVVIDPGAYNFQFILANALKVVLSAAASVSKFLTDYPGLIL